MISDPLEKGEYLIHYWTFITNLDENSDLKHIYHDHGRYQRHFDFSDDSQEHFQWSYVEDSIINEFNEPIKESRTYYIYI